MAKRYHWIDLHASKVVMHTIEDDGSIPEVAMRIGLVTRKIITAFLAMAVLSPGLWAQASEPRVALVIGNSNYGGSGRLVNPASDATDVAAALNGLGFQVSLLTEASRRQMNEALNDFHDRLSQDGSSVGFFWYAGHGIQSGGENYLLPVGAQIKREADIEDEAVSERKLLGLLDDARDRANVIVLDACRDNSTMSFRREGKRGLVAAGEVPPESIIMYSAGLGELAAEGATRNSLFAAAFLKCLGKGGDIAATLKAAAAETQRLTDGAQLPYLYSSLTLGLAFNPRAPAQASRSARDMAASEKSSGVLVVSVASAGILYLDGKKIGDVTPKAVARLGGVEPGNRCLELHYPDGQSERQIATVPGARTTSMAFGYRPVQPKPSLPPNFVHVPGGPFTMGSPPAEAGRYSNEVQHRVSLTGFEMDKYDVTFEEYDAYCAATGVEKPSDNGWGRGTRPVVNVDWHDAVAFCNWRSRQEGRNPAYAINARRVDCDWGANGYRLPTEAEWEYAAKGGPAASGLEADAMYAGSSDLNAMTWNSANSKAQTHPVGQKAPNSLGLYDMSGNVWQWCWDWYKSYSATDQSDPKGAVSGVFRVMRGGGWDFDARTLRSANRGYNGPSSHDSVCGFRLVLSGY